MNKQDCGFIYTQYRDKVFGFVRSKIVNQTEAEDIVQTVFLKVYSNLDKYDETKASLSTWIYTITRNTVYDYLKEKHDHPMLELIDNTVDSAEKPDETILNNEELEERILNFDDEKYFEELNVFLREQNFSDKGVASKAATEWIFTHMD